MYRCWVRGGLRRGAGSLRGGLVAVVAAVALLAAGCSAGGPPETVDEWVEALEDPEERVTALKALGKLGDAAAVPQVTRWLQERGPWQPDAAYTLGQLGDKQAVPALLGEISYAVGTGRGKWVRIKNRTNLNIARALAMLDATEAVPALVKLLRTPELKTREGVIRALGTLGDHRATQPLADVALHGRHPFIRKVAVQALGELADPAGVDALVQMMFVEAPGISFYNEARLALVQTGEPAIEPLLETLARENSRVEAIRMDDGAPLAPGAVEGKAAFVLGALRAPEAEKPMVAALSSLYGTFRKGQVMYASIPAAVIELAYALGQVGGPDARAQLRSMVSEKEVRIREAVLSGLTIMGDRGASGVLVRAARIGSAEARRATINTLSLLGTARDLAAFDKLGKQQVGAVKVAQVAKMVAAARPRLVAAKACHKDVSCWQQKLKDPVPAVRERAAYELGWRRAQPMLADLMGAAEDTEPQVRMAAIWSLQRMESVSVDALKKIHAQWRTKMEYAGPNQEMRRFIARLHTARDA